MLEQSGLGLASDENDLATSRVHVLEGGRIDSNGFIAEATGSGECIELRLVDRQILVVFP